jgi:hypothetical protein
VTYPGSSPMVARYECRGAAPTHGVERCLSFGGLKIDQAIDGEILRVLAPGAIEAACSGEAINTEAAAAARRAVELSPTPPGIRSTSTSTRETSSRSLSPWAAPDRSTYPEREPGGQTPVLYHGLGVRPMVGK